VKVEWDQAKNLANQRKHGVSFEEASKLFRSAVDYLEILDDAHSGAEDRFIALGPIRRGLILIIWTERYEETIRIISARWAAKNEQRLYESFRKERDDRNP
jgi:uncharacterized DUF497 family protein